MVLDDISKILEILRNHFKKTLAWPQAKNCSNKKNFSYISMKFSRLSLIVGNLVIASQFRKPAHRRFLSTVLPPSIFIQNGCYRRLRSSSFAAPIIGSV